MRSLAVLPFQNAQGDEEIGYLCDGVTESLIRQLAGMRSLEVTSLSTVLNFKGQAVDPREAGRQLALDTVLAGTLTRDAGRLLITAELVDVESGTQLWRSKYDRDASDLLSAQAWVPPARVGTVSFVYQTIENTGHRLADGSLLEGYDSSSRGVLVDIDYAVADRFSFSAGLPYISAKYRGPLPSFSALPIDECHCSVSFGLPSHGYSFFGEAVLGRNLKEMRIAIDAGQRLDAISPRLSVQGRYSYAFVKKVIDVPNNRSNASMDAGFLITRRLSSRVVFSWQETHGGLLAAEFDTPRRKKR